MKSVKSTLLLLIILCVCVGGYLYINNTSSITTESPTVFDVEENSIDKITIKSSNADVVFQKANNMWAMIKPKEYKINNDNVLVMVRKLENLQALRVIEKDPDDLSKYGLDKPQLTVTFETQDKTKKSLLVGIETASKYQVYIKSADAKEVFSLSQTEIDLFRNGDSSGFRDTTLFAIDNTAIQQFSFSVNGELQMSLSQYSAGKWKFTEPYDTNAKNDAVMDIVTAITQMKINGFISDTNEDNAKYNLDKPLFSLKVKDKYEKEQTINMGKYDADKNLIYVSFDNQPGIFTIAADIFNPDSIKIGELFNETPLSVNIDKLKRITVIDAGKTYVFERNPDNAETQFLYQKKIINSEAFIALFVNLMALTSDGYDKDIKETTSELKIIYEFIENGDKPTLELYKRNDTSYFMKVNGEKLPFYVFGQKVDLVRRWITRVTKPE